MIGAIASDIIGSIYATEPVKTNLFVFSTGGLASIRFLNILKAKHHFCPD